jgi:hypothetical protein
MMIQARTALLLDHFSSENQRLRVLKRHGTDPDFPISINSQPVRVDKNGRMTVRWKDEDSNQDHTFKLYFTKAYAEGMPTRTLRTTMEGLAITDENGNYITTTRSGQERNHFMLEEEIVRRRMVLISERLG